MAISTTRQYIGTLGNYRVFIDTHTSPGAQTANDITTGSAYVLCAFGKPGGDPDPDASLFAVRCTENTSDHSTEALGHYCLECEEDLTCKVLVIAAG